jgi:hypothetical protein
MYSIFFSTGNFRSTPPPWSSSSSSPLVRNHTPMRKGGGCRICRRVESVSLDFQCNEIDDKKSQSHDLYTLL